MRRSFSLPEGCDEDNIDASFTDGVLQLKIGKKADYEEAGGKKIVKIK
jgi:HSP20 family molecular chaperone IbpA